MITFTPLMKKGIVVTIFDRNSLFWLKAVQEIEEDCNTCNYWTDGLTYSMEYEDSDGTIANMSFDIKNTNSNDIMIVIGSKRYNFIANVIYDAKKASVHFLKETPVQIRLKFDDFKKAVQYFEKIRALI